MNEIVINVPWGGLGDHLFFSHLPRIAKEQGVKRVLVSNTSVFRHDDYKLIWTLNPYFDGFGGEPHYTPSFGGVDSGTNILDRIMLEMGLDDGKRMHEPEFYYCAKHIASLSNKIIYDPNYVSNVGNVSPDAVNRYFTKSSIAVDLETKHRSKPVSIGKPQYDTPGLLDYCDMICSCKQFFCLTSGGATLAAALGKPSICLYGSGQLPMFHHSAMHKYINVCE